MESNLSGNTNKNGVGKTRCFFQKSSFISIVGDGISNSVKIAVKYIFPRWWDRRRAMREFLRYEKRDFDCDGIHNNMRHRCPVRGDHSE